MAPNRKALRELVQPLQPMLSIYLGLRPDTPTVDPAEDLNLRWRALAAQLGEAGADASTVDAVGRHLASLPAAPAGVALFASDGRIRLEQYMPGGDGLDQAHHAAPPRLLPLLTWWQRRPAHVTVVTDRTGADVTAVGPGELTGRTETVVGPDDEIERNAPGGWAQPRYQRRAEDSWRHNAAAVAGATHRALQATRADLLLLAGDVRAVQLLEERLPEQPNHGLCRHHLPGGRQPDGSAPARLLAVDEQVAAHADEVTSRLLVQFDAEGGPRGRTVEGVAATLAALAAGRVETLLVVANLADTRRAWFSPDILCIDDPSQTGGRLDGLREGRLVDVAVRAALLTDAEIRVLDGVGPAEGIGALCRFT
ncbi:MAG: Vms1/Ankzf1 family peptidyl-tRNA hydrolase [Micromonosporaceae bacterium]